MLPTLVADTDWRFICIFLLRLIAGTLAPKRNNGRNEINPGGGGTRKIIRLWAYIKYMCVTFVYIELVSGRCAICTYVVSLICAYFYDTYLHNSVSLICTYVCMIPIYTIGYP